RIRGERKPLRKWHDSCVHGVVVPAPDPRAAYDRSSVMTSLQQTTDQRFLHFNSRRWLRFSLAALLGTGLTFSAFAQDDDPDLTVPESLQNATERTTPPGATDDPDAPRVRVGPDAQQPRVVGRLISIEGNTLTIEDDDRQ